MCLPLDSISSKAEALIRGWLGQKAKTLQRVFRQDAETGTRVALRSVGRLEEGIVREGLVILVADRNRRVREFIGRELSADGYIVLGAKDGRELMAMIDEGPMPDLLILDLDLPYVDGIEVLERLRDLDAHVPVVIHTFLTEYAGNPAIQGAAGFVEKSGDNINRLRATVAEVLQRHCSSRSISVLADSNSGQRG